jgi:PTS system nitrogen regulatory IIA component
MITARITFVLEQDGFAGWQLQQLRQLCGYFRSIFVVYNITRGKEARLNQPLQMMSVGSCRFDVCQVAIEGLDAELACMVLTEYLREHSMLFSTSHKKNLSADRLFDTHSAFHLPFQYTWHTLEPQVFESKMACLSAISDVVAKRHRLQLLEQFVRREDIASTVIASQVASPHMVSDHVQCVTIVTSLVTQPIEWHVAYPPVKLIVAIIIPSQFSRVEIQAITRLTRWLISGKNNDLLLNAKRQETLKGILLHVMGH